MRSGRHNLNTEKIIDAPLSILKSVNQAGGIPA
jgi:hypothetical protein